MAVNFARPRPPTNRPTERLRAATERPSRLTMGGSNRSQAQNTRTQEYDVCGRHRPTGNGNTPIRDGETSDILRDVRFSDEKRCNYGGGDRQLTVM